MGQSFQLSLCSGARFGNLSGFPHAAAPGAMRPAIRFPVAFDGCAAPPESPDEPRSFGPEHAGRKEGFPAKKRA